MSFLVRRLQIAGADVRIDLRRHQALVPQEFLHAPNIGTAIEQMRRKAVAQRVGRSSLIEPRFAEIFFQHPGHAARRQPGAELIRKHRRFAAGLSRGESFRISSHAFKARTAYDPIGERRSLFPLPRMRTMPAAKSRSPSAMPTSSLTRSPAE